MNNKSIILAGGVAIVGITLAIFWWLLSPNWVPLFPNEISESSQQNVVLLLNRKNIEYELDSAKRVIQVKSSDLRDAQLMLAENGQPEEQTAGLEVFNSSDYGLSEFAQNINYQRGMEEELARTIKKLKDVKDARVHLTIKKDSLFEERKQPPKASVVVTPHANQTLNSQVIRGIQEIVAAAVPNLEPKQVVIVTNTGNVLVSANEDLGHDSPALEEKYTRQVSGLLAAIMDENDYKISVSVTTDNKKKVTVEENFYPDVNTGKGFTTKRKVSERNIADGASMEDAPQTQKANEEEFIYSKERSEIVFPSGEVTKITIGIVIKKSISDADRDNIAKLIFNSLGMIESRGDKVSLFVSQVVNKQDLPPVSDSAVPIAPIDNPENNVLLANTHLVVTAFVVLTLSFLLLLVIYLKSIMRPKVILSDEELMKLSGELKDWLHNS